MPIFKTKNENFFKKWSPEMAYVLGFFAADGNLTIGERGNYYLEFNSIDRDIIEKIKNILGPSYKIGIRKRNKNWKDSFRIQIGSKIMCYDLVNLGFTPNKSKRLNFPKMPVKYWHHFIRGYFDGDGYAFSGIYKRNNRPSKNRVLFSGFISGTRRFLEKLRIVLMRLAKIEGGTLYYSQGFRLTFSIKDSLRLYKFLYKDIDTGLYLARKKEVFEKYLNAVVA